MVPHGRFGLVLVAVLILGAGAAWWFIGMGGGGTSSQRARPVGYHHTPHLEHTYASRTMRWGGIIITLYVIYHLMHLTWGNVHPAFISGDTYGNLVVGFQSLGVSLIYVLATSVVGTHVYHGVWSALQTLGINQGNHRRWRTVAGVTAAAIVVGFISIPVAVLTGVIQ